ncbi:sensor histidine kinase [Cellulomonas taurus]|uniref:sensor histidine kinase n=1 Tax=Cellulomonas taurus TaxID=2729175 RepID=UPI00145E3F4E|nr:histidine kinase [Cellulomonas taurus]
MSQTPERLTFWRHTLPGWDAGCYALLALSAASMGFGGSSATERATAIGLLLVLLIGYLTLARPGARRGDQRLIGAYLVLLVIVVSLCTAVNSLGSILLFLGFAQVWYFSTGLLGGTIGSIVLTVSVALANVWRAEPHGMEIAQLAGQYLVGFGFSVALGFWLTRMAEENEVLALLITELEQTRAASARAQHEAGVLAERERVAQQVHDTLAQGFTSIVLLAQAGRSGDEAQARSTAVDLERVARAGLAESRALVAAFGSPALDDGGLSDALDRLLGRFRAETGIEVTVDFPATPVSRDTEVVLLRGVQEALVAARSGGPTHLRLLADGTLAV